MFFSCTPRFVVITLKANQSLKNQSKKSPCHAAKYILIFFSISYPNSVKFVSLGYKLK